jgi:phage tail sheath gpL-like
VPITDPIPTTYRRAATFASILFMAASRALVPIELAVVCVGTRLSTGTVAAETPFECYDATDADTKAGKGSPLALMLRKAFAQGAKQGVCPRIYGVGIAEPGAGTAHVKTLTVTGPATADGNLVVRIAGRTITVGVTSGDAQNTIAANLEDAIDAIDERGELPVTASVSTNVVSCTHKVKGENGGDVVYEVVQQPAGVSVALGSTATGAGVIDITAALDALTMSTHMAIAIENRKSADVTDAKAHTAVAWGPGEKRYRWVFIGAPATLSTANSLAGGANDKTVVVVSCEATPSLGGELAAAAAVKAFSKTLPNANLDFEELDIYPPPAASAYTTSEVESALAAGTTPIVPTDAGDAVMIQRLVTTKTTTNSSPDETQTDLAYSRTAAYMSTQVDTKLRAAFGPSSPEADRLMTDTTLARMRDVILEVNREAERLSIVQDVEDLKTQVQVDPAPSPAYRALATNAYRVVSGIHQVSLVTTQYL